MAGYTVVDSETVLATHLSHLMQVQAAKLLSRTETQELVEHVAKLAPKLIDEVVPKLVPIGVFQKVLQLLLEEGVHIRDIRTIIESLAEHATLTTDPAELEQLRAGLPSPETFARIGLQLPDEFVSTLQFTPGVDAAGRPVIRVTSEAPVTDPLLTFLVEVDWGQGRLVREYSALVDAPALSLRRCSPPSRKPRSARSTPSIRSSTSPKPSIAG